MKRFAMLLTVLVCCALLAQCENKKESAYKFSVIANKGTCAGYFILNDESPDFFDLDSSVTGISKYYSYERELDAPTTVTVHVDSNEAHSLDIPTAGPDGVIGTSDDGTQTISIPDPNSITVYIYESNKIVSSKTFTPTTTQVTDGSGNTTYMTSITGDLSYTFSDSSSSN